MSRKSRKKNRLPDFLALRGCCFFWLWLPVPPFATFFKSWNSFSKSAAASCLGCSGNFRNFFWKKADNKILKKQIKLVKNWTCCFRGPKKFSHRVYWIDMLANSINISRNYSDTSGREGILKQTDGFGFQHLFDSASQPQLLTSLTHKTCNESWGRAWIRTAFEVNCILNRSSPSRLTCIELHAKSASFIRALTCSRTFSKLPHAAYTFPFSTIVQLSSFLV